MYERLQGKNLIKDPPPLRGELEKRKFSRKFYKGHKDWGHEINNCYSFKDQIEELV